MQQQDRLHSLDAVRAFALLLGIVFHATMSFSPTLTAMGWPIVDNSPSDTLSVTFFILHIFRMTTFFVMAGFFARLVICRKGVSVFIEDRRRRILIPFLASLPVQMMLLGIAISWAASKSGIALDQVRPMHTGEQVLIPFPLTHLWFLYVLMLLYVGLLGLRWLADRAIDKGGLLRRFADRVFVRVTSAPAAPLLLAIPVALSFYVTEGWVYWIGIPTPDYSLIPNLPAFVGYGTALLCGWFLHRQVQILKTFERYWPGYLTAAIALTIVCYSMVGMPTAPIHLDAIERALYAGAYGVAIWCWTFAIIGAAIRFLSGESKVRRYWADASYWMYIMHLPIVFGLQTLMMDWNLHWSVKYVSILVVTFAVLLVTYRYWVRPTFIGEALNGRRYPRT